jgi:hypothetical protein
MTRHAAIKGLRRLITACATPTKRRRVRLLLVLLDDQYASVVNDAETSAFEEGVQAHHKSPETGYRDGWERGYKSAIDEVLARTGSPAIARLEGADDEGPMPPVPPTC